MREEHWIELAKLTLERVKDRRAMEWKLAFGLWGGVGSATALLVSTDYVPLGPPLREWLAIGYAMAFLVSSTTWQYNM